MARPVWAVKLRWPASSRKIAACGCISSTALPLSTSDIKAVLAEIGTLNSANGLLLYLDEIQYFNKKQQQSLLECMENGSLTLIASTTENPYFYVYSALLSRSTVFEFKAVTAAEVQPAVVRALRLGEEDGAPVPLTWEEAVPGHIGLRLRRRYAQGASMRGAAVPLLLRRMRKEGALITLEEDALQVSQRTAMRYDREGDDHYDIVSAYQKSMRGSDPDAALHYLGRLLEAGDLVSACRRLMVCACEDVGLAYPQIMPIVKAAVDIANMVGLPEARIPLANAVVLVATSPKSNTAYMGINRAMADLKPGKSGPIPRQLQNKHFDGEDALVKGQNYKYPHDFPGRWVEQQYLPDALAGMVYYEYGENKNEQAARAYWDKIKKK